MNLEKWNSPQRKPSDIINPKISSDMYLQFSSIYSDIKKSSHLADGITLDIGSGMSPYELYFKHVKKFIKLDSFKYLDSKPDIIGDGVESPIKSNSIDTALSIQVLEHIPYPQKMIDEIYRILKKNGLCILTTHMADPLHGMPHDYFRFTKQALKFILFKKFRKIKIKENGGAILSIGQLVVWGIHYSLPELISKPIIVILNLIFKKLDELFFNDIFTTNYIVIAKK